MTSTTGSVEVEARGSEDGLEVVAHPGGLPGQTGLVLDPHPEGEDQAEAGVRLTFHRLVFFCF